MSGSAPEFSLEVSLSKLPKGGRQYALAPTVVERSQIASRLGVPSVDELTGTLHIAATSATIEIKGVIVARLQRECVASLEAMTEVIDEPVDSIIERGRDGEALDVEPEEDRIPREIHEGDNFDLGEFFVQQLSLAMQAYPRKSGAVSLAERYGAAPESSPFDALKTVFKKDKSNQ